MSDAPKSLAEFAVGFGCRLDLLGYARAQSFAASFFDAAADMPGGYALDVSDLEALAAALAVSDRDESESFHGDFYAYMSSPDAMVVDSEEVDRLLARRSDARERIGRAVASLESAEAESDAAKARLSGMAVSFAEGDGEAVARVADVGGPMSAVAASIASSVSSGSWDEDAETLAKDGVARAMREMASSGDVVGAATSGSAMSSVLSRLESSRREVDAAKERAERAREALESSRRGLANSEKAAESADRAFDSAIGGIVKDGAVSRRLMFDGSGYVASSGSASFGSKEFSEMSDGDVESFDRWVRDNAKRFRTRLARSMAVRDSGRIDVAATCKAAAKTGGVPAEIVMSEPRRRLLRLAMLLDVSGSCANASLAMLSFMHSVRTVFGGGCRMYGFVNSLHDISGVYDECGSGGPLAYAATVLSGIPTRGVYSDYGSTLRQYASERMGEVGKDTLFVLIGDARNNRRVPDGCDELRAIRGKSRGLWFLNVEPSDKWDTGDSIASKYAACVDGVVDASTPDGMLSFLESVR